MQFIFRKSNGSLVFNDIGGYQTRNLSTIWCIQQADAIYKWKDFGEITIYTSDIEYDTSRYSYSNPMSLENLVPDFNFHAWPQAGIDDYVQLVKDIDNRGRLPYNINKVGWIGNITTSSIRSAAHSIGKENSNLFNIIDCGNWRDVGNTKLECNNYISTPDLVEAHSILIDIEGFGYSGRTKHLLWSHRPLLLVDRSSKEYFYKYMKEWEHYIPVKRDLSDLVEKTQWCMANYDKAKEIAENGYEFAKKYLTREAAYNRWNEIISRFT
jgi:hypothetical protein